MPVSIPVRFDQDFPRKADTIDLSSYDFSSNSGTPKRIPRDTVREDVPIADSNGMAFPGWVPAIPETIPEMDGETEWDCARDGGREAEHTPGENESFAPEAGMVPDELWESLLYGDESGIPPVEVTVSSPVIANERARKERLERERERQRESRERKYLLLDILLSVFRAIVLSLAGLYQRSERKVQAMKRNGFPDAELYNPKQLFYIALSLPNTADTFAKVRLLLPLMPEKFIYKILKTKKDTVASYQKVFAKR